MADDQNTLAPGNDPRSKRDLVKDHDKFIEKIRENVITPQESLLRSAFTTLAVALVFIGLLAIFSKLNIWSGGAILAIFGYYFYYNCGRQGDILPGEIGVQYVLANPKEEGSRVFSPGKHGELYPFWYPKVISLEQQTIVIPEFEINAAKDENKIIRMKVPSSSAQIRVWHPWRFLAVVGESILGEQGGLVKALQTSMREEGTDLSEGELRKDKTRLVIAAETRADQLSEQWGMEVIDMALPEIKPVNEDISKAHEQGAIEEKQRESEKTEARANMERIREYRELGVSALEAMIQHAVERGKYRGREHIVISSSGSGNNSGDGSGGSGLATAAAQVGAVLGTTFGSQVQKKLSDDEPGNKGKKKDFKTKKSGKNRGKDSETKKEEEE